MAALPSVKHIEIRMTPVVEARRTMAVRRKREPGRARSAQDAQLEATSRLNEFRAVLLKSYAQRNANLINLVADMRLALLDMSWGQNEALDNLIERADTLLIGR